jgi:hypothetical protein
MHGTLSLEYSVAPEGRNMHSQIMHKLGCFQGMWSLGLGGINNGGHMKQSVLRMPADHTGACQECDSIHACMH